MRTGKYQSGQMGQTVNLLAYAFGGSNPSLPTKNCGSSSVDRALAFQAEGRGFEPRLPLFFKILLGKYQSGQMGQTVNLLAYAFGGSNPSLPTKNCGSSSVDRALAFQAEGRGFESRLPLMKKACQKTGFFRILFLLFPERRFHYLRFQFSSTVVQINLCPRLTVFSLHISHTDTYLTHRRHGS